MESIEHLSDEAYAAGIRVMDGAVPVLGMDAVYVKTGSVELILLREDGTQADRTCWLAEELGHHYTGPDRVLHYDTAADWKAEARARKWAHDRLLSPDAIRTAARNSDDLYEIAFTLGVSPAFLKEAIDDYMARGLWSKAQNEKT